MTKTSILLFTITLLTFSCSVKSSRSNRTDAEIIKAIDEKAISNIKTKKLCTGWYYVLDTISDFNYQLDKSSETYYLDPTPIVIKDNIKSTEIYETDFKGQAEDYVGLKIQLDEFGAKKWAYATEKSILKKLAFVIDNKLIAASQVNCQIKMGVTAINRTEYDKKDIEKFKKLLGK